MRGKNVKYIKRLIRVNYSDLIIQLYDENWFTRLKFAYRLITNKKPFIFKWK